MRLLPILSFGAGFLVACGATSSSSDPCTGAACAAASPFEEARSTLARDPAPAVTSSARTQSAVDNTNFALDLFKKSSTPTQNLMQAPFSLSTALAMTFAGARGTTADEMAQALHFTLPTAELHASFNLVDAALEARAGQGTGKSENEPSRLRTDNLLFSALGEIEPPFLDLLAVNYGAGVQQTDLASEESLALINGYVATQTEQRIPTLLSELPPDTKLLLLDTVYVNAAWQKPFAPNATSERSFTTPSGAKGAPFMSATGTYASVTTVALRAVEIPLSTPGLVMDVVMPADLAAYEAALDAAALDQLWSTLDDAPLYLALPKFKLEPAANGSLRSSLQTLGMQRAFQSDAADFSGISTQALFLFDVVQKTFFEVDEGGLEAAAASAVVGGGKSGGGPPIPSLIVDHPFLVVVRDVSTHTVLFLGHVVDPTAP